MTRAEADKLTWEELEALGLDTCGLPLDKCPGAPPCGELTSWIAARGNVIVGNDGVRRSKQWHHGADGLTDRQREILVALRQGGTVASAASVLGISPGGVAAMISKLRQRGFDIPHYRTRR